MKKRLALSLLTIAAISLMVSAATFALFSATTTNADNTFTAGTVTLGQPADALIDISNIAPGDSGVAGTFAVTYTGNLDAWLGLDTAVNGAIFGGSNPLTIDIVDNAGNHYNQAAQNQVVGTAPVASGTTVTFTANYSFPLAADNSYQGATGTLTMSVHAVQARNNTTGNGPTSWE